MFVIKRTRIQIMLSAILVGTLAFGIQISNKEKQALTVETTSTPASDKTILIDAGHGSPDEGAESKTGTTEAQINLKIALKVQNLLEQTGSTVILTRSDENGIYNSNTSTIKQKKITDIKNRVKIGNESSADIFVSIHLNKIPQQQYYGWQCFFNSKNENSKILAEQLQENLNKSMQKENKRVALKLNSIYIMKNVEIPISIVECGFLSNPEEEKQLQEDEYQNRLAWGIYNGITEYFYNIVNNE